MTDKCPGTWKRVSKQLQDQHNSYTRQADEGTGELSILHVVQEFRDRLASLHPQGCVVLNPLKQMLAGWDHLASKTPRQRHMLGR